LPKRKALLGRQPVAQTHTQISYPFKRRMPAARSELRRPESDAS
jgi:hypothetical protein